MSLITIREANKDEAALIAKISRSTFQETFGPVNTEKDMQLFLDEQFTMQQLVEEVGKPGHRHFLAWYQDQPAGYLFIKYRSHPALLTDAAIEISRIYCLAAFQGKGIGKALMLEAMKEGRTNHCSTVWLGVWKENKKALTFYQSFGFDIFGTTDFLLGMDMQQDWLMQCSISNLPE
jgi:ribosomal protein S18 acetylase RimI-like enzyme